MNSSKVVKWRSGFCCRMSWPTPAASPRLEYPLGSLKESVGVTERMMPDHVTSLVTELIVVVGSRIRKYTVHAYEYVPSNAFWSWSLYI
jgi:hypothetical protein